ncbi:hypothetical protein BBK36DRAFT_8214 [Trichoderma citrinoviride]|uniref:Uncharacterized protein n=1 Tax=Trichoderma citrinoviride TaxID=58853 RepID=A0A2T4AZY9_9HYPO|nr:hypothetical protein BBK36DRAFT_8214 [Trichoderma citrinoviride]PTB62633.1 hypothetical protein BBK36DRAFT_8214 [Trichoderma citrinoviride]
MSSQRNTGEASMSAWLSEVLHRSDGLYWYQGTTYEEEAKETMKALNELVNYMGDLRASQIKVLITNPTLQQQQSWGFDATTIEL